MNNSLIVGIVVFLLVVGAGYFYFMKPAEAPIDTTLEENVPSVESTMGNESQNQASSTNTSGNGNTNTSTGGSITPETPSGMRTVSYTDGGFSPKTVEIRVGETVRFVNISTRAMWVGSNDHPTHTIYPEFDQKTSVEAGGVYEFKFEKAGTWGYHNHRRAADTGTVIVR